MIQLTQSEMTYWIFAGYKLARLEFIWGSKFPEAQAQFEPSKREILYMLNGEELVPDETDYRAFCNSILFYFMRNAPEKYTSILLGICIQRSHLVGCSSDKDANDEMLSLAQSALNGISNEIVKDKGFLFSVILLNKDKELQELCSIIWDCINDDEGATDNAPISRSDSATASYLFISYSSKEFSTASTIKDMFEKEGIACWMAPDSIPAGSEYTEEIVDAIENSAGVLLILSQNSQDSKWVPKELDIAITSDKTIFPIHIDQSSIVKKMRLRLSDSQVIEAYGHLDVAIQRLISDIKKTI